MSNFKSGFVNLVGRPNVGKSTLLNALMKEKIAITSARPQTTRNIIRAVLTENESQIIFMDTPGIHKPKTKLGQFMVSSAMDTITDVDVIVFLTDVSDKRSMEEDRGILEKIKTRNVPAILVLNKIDLIKKEDLLPFIKHYSEQMNFHAIVPVSALSEDGTDAVLKEIKKILPEGPQYFPEDMLTDQPEKVIVAEIIREKILNFLEEEVPHGIGVEVISFKEREKSDIFDIQTNIYCEKESHKAIVIGKSGAMLKKIGTSARKDIERFLRTKVFLELWVKVKEDWRNNDFMLKSLGYSTKAKNG